MIQTVNPYKDITLEKFQEDKFHIIDQKLNFAERSFNTWKKIDYNERAEFIKNLTSVLERNKKEYARLITTEMGKVIKESYKEIDKCIWACNYFVENGEPFLKDETVQLDEGQGFISYEPLGCILGVMPWNYPFWQLFRFAVPTLIAGNVIVLKHASNVPLCSQKIEEIFKLACFPEGVFQNLVISSSKIDNIIKDDRVQGVSLTGSVPAGSEVAQYTGKHIKKTVLELGGSDPFIVLEDADIEEAAKTGVKARMKNFGQSCNAAKRFILHESIAEKFLNSFKKELNSLKFGDPMDESSDYASLSSVEQKNRLVNQVKETINMGGKIYWQGQQAPNDKAFFNPVILTNINSDSPAYKEELFGPVASIFVVKDTHEAVHIANDTEFGLGAAIWTKDVERGKKLAREIQSGIVYINNKVSSRPELPFGGIKNSGVGREMSVIGIREFTNKKSIWYPL